MRDSYPAFVSVKVEELENSNFEAATHGTTKGFAMSRRWRRLSRRRRPWRPYGDRMRFNEPATQKAWDEDKN